MASTNLYPPIVDSITPAFIASGDSSYCRLYFSLSKYSSSTSPIKSIHISVIKQSTGQSVVNKEDNAAAQRFRATGIIIINGTPTAEDIERNLYYVDILNEDIQSGDIKGWYPSWIYKMQIRLSEVPYSLESQIGQSAWLNINASYFSEWSTYSTTKAISRPHISIPILNDFDSEVGQSANRNQEYNLNLTTLDLNGTYSNADESETLYSYRFKLYDAEDNLIEDSDILYSNQYYNPNQMHYLFKTEFRNSNHYKLTLNYVTLNKYESNLYFKLYINAAISDVTPMKLVSVETINTIDDEEYRKDFNKQTFLEFEQEEGLVGLKLYSDETGIYNGNICIRRSDSKDNFQTWEDMKIIVCINQVINNLPIYFDKTAESGVWYKYGVQTIDTDGYRTRLVEITKPILRDYEYSYLVGEGGRQLKLKYNNVMNSYTYNYSESKTDTIGGKYPFITRNGNMQYRTIPVNGLISFNMDESQLFTNDLDMYGYAEIANLYNKRRHDEYLGDYDYRKEFDFREKVLAFLYDGKPKLFKSATEGNIIVRLMQVSAQPNQTLNRMIFSFTSTAHEIADATIENYLKYGFFEVGEYATSFITYTSHIGQIQLDCNFGDNIIEKIWQKYDFSDRNVAGLKQTLLKIHDLKINFTDKPIKVYNNVNELVLGNNISYNGNIITIRADRSREYIFDENIDFVKTDSVVILGGVENIYNDNNEIINNIHIDVDFIYEMTQEPYKERAVRNKITERGMGQIYGTYSSGSSIYRDVYYKYYYNWGNESRFLSEINWTCIEANPGAIFLIKDFLDTSASEESMYHEINQTGLLNLEGLGAITNIKYIGMRTADGGIDTTKDCDVIVDYSYYVTINTYEEEA